MLTGRFHLNGLSRLTKIRAKANRLERIDLTGLTSAERIYLFDNELTTIEIDGLDRLRFLDVRSNPMPDEVYDYLDGFGGLKASHDGNTEDWK